MAERSFLAANDLIAYPLVDGDNFDIVEGGHLPRKGLADAMFVMGSASGYQPGSHDIYLERYERTWMTMRFYFYVQTVGLPTWCFMFSFPASTKTGTTIATIAQGIVDSNLLDPEVGEGFLTVGNLSEFFELGEGVFHTWAPRVEPSLVVNPSAAFATSLSIANQRRVCPTGCNQVAVATPESVCMHTKGLLGGVKFLEGYNAKIGISTVDNAIQLGAEIGAGQGEPCHDILIGADGACGFEERDCETCDGFIKTINGVPSVSGSFLLLGGAGVVVLEEPASHTLRIRCQEELRLCQSSSSSE